MPDNDDPTAPADGIGTGEDLGRELSARTVLFHQAVADRLGIGLTDQKCLDYVYRASATQPVTAGHSPS